MTHWIIENSLLTACVMLVVFALCRLNRRRPAFCHLLWLLAFASLVMPPVPLDFAPGTQLRAQLAGWLPAGTEAPLEVEAPVAPIFSGELEGVSEPATGAAPAGLDLELRDGHRPAPWLAQISLSHLALAIWGLGALLLSGLAIHRILRFHRLVRGAPAENTELIELVDEVAERLGLQAPPIRLMEGIGSPAIWCFGPPRLLWPTEGGRIVRHEGQRSLIAHELAHVARRDHWVSRLDVLAIGLLWWNPLFWIIRHEVRHYAELSCDAWALWAYPTCRRDFAEALIESQERTQCATMAIEGLCATNSEFRNFERRLTMIMKTNVSRQVSKGAAAATLLTTLLVLPGFSGDGPCTQKVTCDSQVAKTCIDEKLAVKELAWKAEEHFKNQAFADAMGLYYQVLERDPMNGKAHGRLGYMLVGEGQLEKAKKHFKLQFKSGHEVSTAVYNLSCTYALEGDVEKGSQFLAKSVRRGFTNAELMSRDSDIESLRASENYAWAVKAAAKSAKLRAKLGSGDLAEDPVARALVYDVLGEICTEDGQVQNDAGLTYLLAENYVGARQAFERQVAAGFDVPRAHYNLACAYALDGMPSAALTSLETAVELGMAYDRVLEDKDLASLHGMPRFTAAAERLRAPSEFKKRLKAAESAEEVERVTGILQELKANPAKGAATQSWAAFELGRLQLRTGEPTASIASFQEAASLGFAMDRSAFQIGQAHGKLGNTDKALSFYEQAVQLGFADTKSMEWGLQLCGMLESEKGEELIQRTTKWKKAKDKKKWDAYPAEAKAAKAKKAWDTPADASNVSGMRF